MIRESHRGASPPSPSSDSEPLAVSQDEPAVAFCGTRRIPSMPVCVASRTDGSERASTDTMRRPLFVTAATLLNLCSLCLVPPTKKADPSTSSRLERTEPSIDICTTRTSPSCNAKKQITSSVTLPKEALRRPPSVSFVYFATSSVTKDTRSAKGTRARRAKVNTYASPHSVNFAAKAKGVNTNKMFILLPRTNSLRVVRR
mmetsp:Transcript_54727/g.123190  ORF Transcript_54727/g.123190 Transcript_54727/m.123190 type:complete len:201 (+) Transcript_54727:757-1359(+)